MCKICFNYKKVIKIIKFNVIYYFLMFLLYYGNMLNKKQSFSLIQKIWINFFKFNFYYNIFGIIIIIIKVKILYVNEFDFVYLLMVLFIYFIR